MKSAVLRAWVLVFAFSPGIASSGELECGILSNCRIDGVMPSVKWKPSGCSKPYQPPMYFGSSVKEYNMAVDSFNYWQSQVTSYVNCVRSEAAADIKKLPEIFVDGVKQVEQEMSGEVDRARSTLQMMRPR